MREFAIVVWLSIYLAGCSAVQSSVASLMEGDGPRDETYAGRQHFPVTPGEAVEMLVEVAPQHGWQVVSTGDEYGAQGPRGKFFRIEMDKGNGGAKTVSGVFYSDPAGAYVRISDNNGLPEALVEPLVAAIKQRTRDR